MHDAAGRTGRPHPRRRVPAAAPGSARGSRRDRHRGGDSAPVAAPQPARAVAPGSGVGLDDSARCGPQRRAARRSWERRVGPPYDTCWRRRCGGWARRPAWTTRAGSAVVKLSAARPPPPAPPSNEPRSGAPAAAPAPHPAAGSRSSGHRGVGGGRAQEEAPTLAPGEPVPGLWEELAERTVALRPDLVASSDLPGLVGAGRAARELGVGHFHDCHELYLESSSFRPSERAALQPFERPGCAPQPPRSRSTRASRRYERRYGRKPRVVRNGAPRVAEDLRPSDIRGVLGLDPTARVVLYQGGFAAGRGLELWWRQRRCFLLGCTW